jgi:hypothetical protein
MLTETWGGPLAALVPTDGQSIHPTFLKLLKAHDPDTLRTHGFRITDEFRSELQSRLSLLEHFNHIPLMATRYPFSSLGDVVRAMSEESRHRIGDVAVVRIENGDPISELLIRASAGSCDDSTLKVIAPLIELRDEIVRFEDGKALFLPDSVVPFLSGFKPNLRTLALAELAGYGDGRDYELPVLVVCGEALDDFCLYWTLRALRGPERFQHVFWLPSVTTDKASKLGQLMHHYVSCVTSSTRDVEGGIVLLSMSKDLQSIQPFRDALQRLGEAKTKDLTSNDRKQIQKIVNIAATARLDFVVLVTSSPEWASADSEFIRGLQSQYEKDHVEIRTLRSRERLTCPPFGRTLKRGRPGQPFKPDGPTCWESLRIRAPAPTS